MLRGKGHRLKEFVVPLLVVGVLGSMLLPLAPWILDLLIVTNLVLAVGLLATSLQISDPLKLSALPTILLLCTLYRLCLNVSTTRLILGSAQGGHVVEAFGSFVIGGNVGVGIVIFVILTFIQFIVVAKGSERVAEVAARFTLDAMPGKQMSIDADVRAGLYDMQTARLKRQELQMESRFYGALDGAMKFVKGDAIAGIFIVAINCLGGFCVGLFHGLSFEEALHTYTMLTIGDGLSSQIPSLLNSLAAGLVVTRVGGSAGQSLSVELAQQLMQSKMVMVMAGGFSCFLGMVPGMPPIPLFGVGGLLLIGGLLHLRRSSEAPAQIPILEYRPRGESLIHLEIGKGFAALGDQLRSMTEELRKIYFERTGILLSRMHLSISDEIEGQSCCIRIRGTIASRFESVDRAQILEASVQCLQLRRVELLDDLHSRRMLDAFEPIASDLVSNVVPHVLSLTQLTELLKGLAKEGVSLRHFDLILQSVAEGAPKAANDRILLEEVRIALGRIICGSILRGSPALRCLIIHPRLDTICTEAERERMPLDQEVLDYIVEGSRALQGGIDCVVTSRGARRIVSDLLSAYELAIPVIAHQELCKDIAIEVIGELSMLGESHEPHLKRVA